MYFATKTVMEKPDWYKLADVVQGLCTLQQVFSLVGWLRLLKPSLVDYGTKSEVKQRYWSPLQDTSQQCQQDSNQLLKCIVSSVRRLAHKHIILS